METLTVGQRPTVLAADETGFCSDIISLLYHAPLFLPPSGETIGFEYELITVKTHFLDICLRVVGRAMMLRNFQCERITNFHNRRSEG